MADHLKEPLELQGIKDRRLFLMGNEQHEAIIVIDPLRGYLFGIADARATATRIVRTYNALEGISTKSLGDPDVIKAIREAAEKAAKK